VNPLIQTNANQLSAAADYVSKGGKLDQNDLIEMAFQQDTYKDIQQVAEDTSARDAEQARQEAINAQMAREVAERQRQQAQAIAAEEEAERQRQAAIAKQARLAYAAMEKQLMETMDRGTPSASEVQAAMERATQVDTFSEAGGDRGMGNFGGEQGMWT